ncbi:MAG: acyltransferase [Clostridia bacterium]|nr:acyltransferase [Clostridia bacterium]
MTDNLDSVTSAAAVETKPPSQLPVFRYDVIDILRLALMLVVSIQIFGVKNNTLGYTVNLISGFAQIAFFMISGYLVLRDDADRTARIKRAIKRTALAFLIMLIVYFGINTLFYYIGGINILKITPYTSKRFWFEFLILNRWPYDIGSLIWYVQALLYAYIIIFILDKLKLLKYDFILFILFFVITLVSGEFSLLLSFHPLKYAYIPQGFLNCALPYTLLGCFMHRKQHLLARISPAIYVALAILGIILCPIEIKILGSLGKCGYTGHLIGMLFVAFAVCSFCFLLCCKKPIFEFSYFELHSAFYFKTIYYIIQPISVVIATVLVVISSKLFADLQDYMWAICFAVSFILAFLFGLIRDLILRLKYKQKNLDDNYFYKGEITDENNE